LIVAENADTIGPSRNYGGFIKQANCHVADQFARVYFRLTMNKTGEQRVVVMCGDVLPHRKLSESFWGASRFTPVHCSEDSTAVFSLCRRLQPALLIATEAFLERQAPSTFVEMTGYGERVKVLVILEEDSPETTKKMLLLGCRGVLVKGFSQGVLKRAMGVIVDGEVWAPRRVVSNIISDLLQGKPGRQPNTLTPREGRILELILQGRKNLEIAKALFISPETVRWHKRRLYRKIGGANGQVLSAAARKPPSSHSVAGEQAAKASSGR